MKIIGTGSALPEKVVTNEMLTEFLDTSDEWIFTRTGIKTRHVITDERLEDLGAEAALKALEMSGLTVSDIDFFICSNVVCEYVTPGLSCVIAEKIGLTCPMIDINCACPGFVYALDIAETYYRAGRIKTTLIVCAEEPTRMASWKDRSTCILFGDGAGAAVLGPGENIKGTRLRTDPDVAKIWELQTLVETPFIAKQEQVVPIQLKGREVFRFAVEASSRQTEELLHELGIDKERISWILLHQANQRIIDAIMQYMDQPASKFPANITDHGNSSSASCPILLDECNRKGMFKSGDLVIFSAFGAGLLSATAIVEW